MNRALNGAGWWVMALLAVGVAGYALSLVFVPASRGGFVVDLLARSPVQGVAHLTGGAVALITGALQFHAGLRNRYPAVHRWTGRVYLLAVASGGVAAFLLALDSFGGPVTHFGFGGLAVCWLLATGIAWRMILRGDVAAHRRWMIRSYALTLAAVTLRFYLPASLMSGIPFEEAYPAIAWMCWVPNLVVAEWWVLRRR